MDGLKFDVMKVWRREAAIAEIKRQPFYGSWFQALSFRDGAQWGDTIKFRRPKDYQRTTK